MMNSVHNIAIFSLCLTHDYIFPDYPLMTDAFLVDGINHSVHASQHTISGG